MESQMDDLRWIEFNVNGTFWWVREDFIPELRKLGEKLSKKKSGKGGSDGTSHR